MNAISIGPMVFDGARFAAIVTILLFLFVAAIAARLQQGRRNRQTDAAAQWAIAAVLAWILGARLGFVIANWDQFAVHPLDAVKLWQGGFAPRAGWAAGVAILLVALLRDRRAIAGTLIAGATVAFMTHQIIGIALPRPAVTLPNMDLIALDGGNVPLAGGDKPVVLNLWASWCPPCRREMPMMVDLASAAPDVDFVFANQGESAAQVSAFLADQDLPSAGMVRDPQQRLMSRLRAIGLPSTLVFDAAGTLVAAQTGEVSRAALNEMIEKARKD